MKHLLEKLKDFLTCPVSVPTPRISPLQYFIAVTSRITLEPLRTKNSNYSILTTTIWLATYINEHCVLELHGEIYPKYLDVLYGAGTIRQKVRNQKQTKNIHFMNSFRTSLTMIRK